jgi:hypothetical protein
VLRPEVPDPIAAFTRFLDEIEPYDPEPGRTVATVALRSDGQAGEFALTQRAVAALTELLNGYTDPDDFGFCARCNGRRLDHNLRCRDCGYVNGIFGLVVAERAADVARREPTD